MTWILFPALIALIVKLVMLVNSTRTAWAGQKWISLIAVLAVLNLSEVLIYSGYIENMSPSYLIKSYYVCCVATMICCYIYVADGANYAAQKLAAGVYLFIGGLLAVTVLGTDLVVGSYEVGSMPIAAVKGEFFWAFNVFTLVSTIVTFIVLGFNYKNSSSADMKVAYAYTVIALTPLAFTAIAVLGLKVLGFDANGTMFIPLATTLFLLITAKGRDSSQLEIDPRMFNPVSIQAKTARNIRRVQTQLSLSQIGYREAVKIIETELMECVLVENKGNISATARAAGVHRTMVYRKVRGDNDKGASAEVRQG